MGSGGATIWSHFEGGDLAIESFHLLREVVLHLGYPVRNLLTVTANSLAPGLDLVEMVHLFFDRPSSLLKAAEGYTYDEASAQHLVMPKAFPPIKSELADLGALLIRKRLRPVREIAEWKEEEAGNKRQIIITSIPYGVDKGKLEQDIGAIIEDTRSGTKCEADTTLTPTSPSSRSRASRARDEPSSIA